MSCKLPNNTNFVPGGQGDLSEAPDWLGPGGAGITGSGEARARDAPSGPARPPPPRGLRAISRQAIGPCTGPPGRQAAKMTLPPGAAPRGACPRPREPRCPRAADSAGSRRAGKGGVCPHLYP